MLSNVVSPQSSFADLLSDSYQHVQDAFSSLPFTPSFRNALVQSCPSPFLVDIHTYRELANAHDAIIAGLRAVVSQWSTNEALQNKLSIHPKIAKVLRKAPASFPMGTVRPDLLFDQDGGIKICEINGRFPLNGYFVGAVANNALHEHSMHPSSPLAKLGLSAVSATMSFIPDLRKRVTACGADIVWILNHREPEHDLAVLGAALDVKVRRCPPAQLMAKNGKLFCKEDDGRFTEIRSCVLELYQDEFLALDDDVLEAIAILSYHGHALNDLRTIFLVHDKRMLHLLLSDCYELDHENRKLLHKYIVPTALAEEVLANKQGFEGTSLVLKPSENGKGEGIIMQKNMSSDKFYDEMCIRIAEAPHVVQSYVKQRKFELISHTGETKHWKTVGILSSMDGRFYGPGPFRSNEGDLISVAGGGVISYPVMQLYGIPADSRSMHASLRSANGTPVLRSLRKHGLALVGVRERLGNKLDLANFLSHKLGAKCRTHSDLEGEVWDVRPAPNWTLKDARSHTTRPFEIHTDASFEKEPPEYVAMSVIHADRRGGGLLSIAKISDAVNRLSKDQLDVLETVKPRWIVPDEFRKSGGSDTFAPVLKSTTKARFRRDKISVDHLPAEEASAFQKTFETFCSIVEECNSKGMIVPEQTIIILDNQRFAHARSAVMDLDRHLHRVRFDLPHLNGVRVLN